MYLPVVITTLLAATSVSAASHYNKLSKRCSPAYDPDLARGYYPPAPCWQAFDPACQPFIRQGTEMTVDAKHKLAIVFGVDSYCAAEIAEELRREKAGVKNYGWTTRHGNLTYIDGGILVISNMTETNLARYAKLGYMGPPWGTGEA